MKSIFKIKGMHCNSCVSTIEKTLYDISGVNFVSVNLPLENVAIEYDDSLSPSLFKSILDKAGFDLIIDADNDTINHNDVLIKKLINTLIFGVPLFIFSMYEMMNNIEISILSIFIQLILCTALMVIGREYHQFGLNSIIRLRPDMNSLILIGTGSAYIYSIISSINLLYKLNITGFNKLYFESAGVIILFITIGRYLEKKAKIDTKKSLKKLLETAPMTGFIELNNQWVETNINKINIGSWVMVKPGGQIPVDGIIIEGHSFVDESAITGESIPIEKKVNDKVLGATINGNGKLIIQAETLGKDTIFSRIIKLVEETQATKAPIQKIVDKISYIFVPIVCFLAILSSIYWYIITNDLAFGINILISVLIIACPCALGLATPTAILVGSGIASERGIHFKSSKILQIMHKIDTIVLDKTGTLTKGDMFVSDLYTKRTENDFLEILCSIENASDHPFSKAIMKFTKNKQITLFECTDFETLPGEGIIGTIEGNNIFIGKIDYIKNKKITIPEDAINKDLALRRQGKSIMHCASDQNWIGLVALEDEIKPESEATVYKMQKSGLDVWMLSGDNEITTSHIANQLGIKNVVSNVLPSGKSKLIKKLQSEKKIVAMVGDGINDAPALAQADIGISIGSGTDVAIETSDVVLINQNIMSILEALKLSKKIIKKIKQNLFWAFAYNIISIPIAMGILYFFNGYLLNPMIAGLTMTLSSLSILLNTLLLKK